MNWKNLIRVGLIFVGVAIAGAARAGTCPSTVPSGITVCKYVDYSSGSDSNSGDTESSPWKHAPGMLGLTTSGGSTGDGCASNCSSFSTAAGDGIILKGGTVWPYTTLPWLFTSSGSSSGSTFGCTGSGCIYIGIDTSWNQGIVNAVTLTRDVGGCSPSSAPTVAFSGGGGTGAAATAYVIPSAAGTQEPNVAGFVYLVKVTNQGSAYTSNPTVTISGDGCTGVTAVADIYRPVIDAGANSSITWPVGYGSGNLQRGPGLSINASYVIVDHLEIRNILQVARDVNGVSDGIETGFINMVSGGPGHNTVENSYIHGRFTNCTLSSCNAAAQEGADAGISSGDTADEFSGNTLTNGDSFLLGTSSTGCAQNFPCIFSESDILNGSGGSGGTGEMQGNYEYAIRWMTHWGGNSTALPVLIHNNEMWLILYDTAFNSHINEMYLQYNPAIVYEYNNIFHTAVSGASNQQQMSGTNGVNTQYFFNNVSWGLGGGTPNWGIDGQTSAGADGSYFYFYNNTIYSNASGTTPCINDNASTYASSLKVTLQNNYCVTNQNPYYAKSSGSTYQNQAGSTAQATVEASSVVDSVTTILGEGYSLINLLAPVALTNDTVAFAGSSNSANLTSLCTGYLVALCSDISGNARPTSGGWQAGAYNYGASGSSSQSAPVAPTGLTATAE